MFKSWNIAIWEYDFLSPHWLWLLLLIPFLIRMAFYLDKNKAGDFKFSRTEREQKNLGKDGIKYIRWSILTIYIVVASLLIAAFARPFHWSAFDDNDSDYKNGIDIVIALDISGSMLAQDFLPNRLEVAKKVAKDFIKGRKGDRIGLVAYEAEAFTACPATTDYEVLYQQIDQLQFENGPMIIDMHLPHDALISPKTEMDRFIHDQFPYLDDQLNHRLPYKYPERPSKLNQISNPTV